MSGVGVGNILLGVSGSVAAIKVPEVYAILVSHGLSVRIVATKAAMHFLNSSQDFKQILYAKKNDNKNNDKNNNDDVNKEVPLLLWQDASEWNSWNSRSDAVVHIELRNWADIFVICPLDANTLSKLSHGLCDNLLTCVARAWDIGNKPMIAFPAMNSYMWSHPLTAPQIKILTDVLKIVVVQPVEKYLVCGDYGIGGLEKSDSVASRIIDALHKTKQQQQHDVVAGLTTTSP
eukprot:GHVS01020787.1.p1 GENE.GHVS01020787.1~~GHVS01020787.1.p1  ORF type:complete len:233 (-),score=49.02 GHVS01020787.1:425-1123(-)